MEVDVCMQTSLAFVPLVELEKLVSELKILAKKEIPHDEAMIDSMGLSRDPKDLERKIYVAFSFSYDKPISYRVEDSILRKDGSGTARVGYEEYNSVNLRKD